MCRAFSCVSLHVDHRLSLALTVLVPMVIPTRLREGLAARLTARCRVDIFQEASGAAEVCVARPRPREEKLFGGGLTSAKSIAGGQVRRLFASLLAQTVTP